MKIIWDWKSPGSRYRIEEPHLGLKGSILDGLNHVIGEVEGEKGLVELETIVNRPHLPNFSILKVC